MQAIYLDKHELCRFKVVHLRKRKFRQKVTRNGFSRTQPVLSLQLSTVSMEILIISKALVMSDSWLTELNWMELQIKKLIFDFAWFVRFKAMLWFFWLYPVSIRNPDADFSRSRSNVLLNKSNVRFIPWEHHGGLWGPRLRWVWAFNAKSISGNFN